MEPYDVIIIGGGINGAGIARDAAMRGLRVCLLEAKDWGGGTSSKSSMLAHGGLRYLEHFELGLVHEALQDREMLLQTAPHLVKPLQFVYPLLPDVASRRTVRVGLWLYDLLSHGKSVSRRGFLTSQKTLATVPGLDHVALKGAATYWDAQFHSVDRLVWELVLDARRHGATCHNHTPVETILHDDGVATGVQLTTGKTIQGRTVINATGPWVDRLTPPSTPQLIRGTKGIHLAVPAFLQVALIVRALDGRTFFFLPWRDWTLIGTTDTDFQGDPREATANPKDVAYLLTAARRYFPNHVFDVQWTYAGVRPLVAQSMLTPSSVTRRHALHDHAAQGVANLWSLQGGKLTTYRHFSEQVVNALCKRLGRPTKLRPTRTAPLPGTPLHPWPRYRADAIDSAQAEFALHPRIAAHLIDTYGAQWRIVLEGRDATRISKKQPHLWAQLEHAVAEEDVCHIGDFMLRRTHLGLAPAGNLPTAKSVARRMQTLLGWSDAKLAQELAHYEAEIRVFLVP